MATDQSPRPALPAVDVMHYRRAMGRLASGVSVVSTFAGGHDHAMTADTVTSVSLSPLLVLVCAEEDGRWLDAVRDSGVWGISIMAASARASASWLSIPGRPLHGQLDRVPHHRGAATGVALLDDSLANLECSVSGIHPAGDHAIVLGEVLTVHTPESVAAALVHHRGGFGVLT